jgi:O-methyltransferase involved in polyketide biosynthesis
MYLTPEAVRELFSQTAGVSGVGSRIAFSYIPAGLDGQLDAGRWTRLMQWLQKVIGEPWIWSIHPEKLGIFLKETGWTITPELTGVSGLQGVEYYAVAQSQLT